MHKSPVTGGTWFFRKAYPPSYYGMNRFSSFFEFQCAGVAMVVNCVRPDLWMLVSQPPLAMYSKNYVSG
ncbi:hypothetical protein LZ757_09235 [Xylella fastidiosa subsp. morus]|uniref:hypothetical protein n=1 Tax=Xylella fastidiosa TaxID=2371 RepID=UPI0012BAF3BE|nr:hypothetical protein [Xylella fastidiosa]MBE0261498.1 hypothetical protein [Xylella fastidiosa subsp. fastidiosa]MBE0264210.1 hypothetical protein [Xylella fastidiosa subsp. fastidiosa]MBE0265889.1 hypothetical protein [Xylella fastidiosa subsp. fastidiosa]MBE0270309.1 hypothetical protein [Xylella fastidiosa subsp. fastidiosa]MBE0279080.1 hypothetical protein [Xylella fastidiosa subsp. fastidiosa]